MINLRKYGCTEETITDIARVSAVHKERYELISEYGTIYARLKTTEYYSGYELFPTVGDFVKINYIENGDSQIVKTLPRRTFFSRRDPTPGRGEQAVAANFDYVFILASLNRDFNIRRLERYLTMAWQSGAEPVVVLTKADIVDAKRISECTDAISNIAPGVSVYPISSYNGYGLDDLEKYLQSGKTIVFLGSSGVGKSSLVNTLAGENVMQVNVTRDVDESKGRHTTTHRQLIFIRDGVMIIDTPGMRELGMWSAGDGLSVTFSDVEKILARRCRFSDCRHENEPGCAVRIALDSGELDRDRWNSYLKLKSESKFAEDRDEALREKQRKKKEIAIYSKNLKKRGGKYGN